MRRIWVVFLALLLALSGCGSAPAGDGRTLLRLDSGGSATLSEAARLFNASSEDYRVVLDDGEPDIVADRAGYESSELVDITSYVDSGMGREDILPFLLESLEEDGALYALPVRWGGMSYGCSRQLLGDRLTLTEAEALALMDELGEGTLLFPGWVNGGDIPWQLQGYLPEYDRETELDEYYNLPSLLRRVNINSVEKLAAMVTEEDALWDTGCPGFGPATDCLSLSILTSCENVDGAWEFLSFVYGPDSISAIEVPDDCCLPAGAGQLYSRLSEFDGVDEAALALARAYVDGMELAV